MRIVLAHFKDQTLQHLRAPGYLLPTLALPGLFYFLFEGPDTDEGLVTFLMASYAMWAILGVAFFQFGAGIAEERTTAWERFLRTLPLSGSSGWPGGAVGGAVRRSCGGGRDRRGAPDQPGARWPPTAGCRGS